VIARLLRLVVAATLAAGVVGLVRQRTEAERVRRGELPPPATVVDAPPRRPYGPVARWLATWIPQRPHRPAGRLLAAVWASPLTLAGALVAFGSGRVPRWDPDLGCFVTRQVGGASRFALGKVGAQANAIGHVVLAVGDRPSPALLAHEAVHVRQAERLGPLLFPVYAWLGALHGYRDHPLERAARLGARQAARRAVDDGVGPVVTA
jgi:hypothetical protein